MIIQCPQCKAQARLPESQEGSKVRCNECGRVYVAVPPGAARAKRGNPLPIYIAVGAGVLILAVVGMNMSGGDKRQVTAAPEPEPEVEEFVAVDYVGWDSAPVRTVRDLHRAALAYDATKLRSLLDGEHAWARVQEERTKAAEEPVAEGEEPIVVDTRAWSELAQDEKAGFLDELIEELTKGAAKELVADWTPYDGEVLDEREGVCTVKVAATSVVDKDSTAAREIQWQLVRDGERWRAFSWKRIYSQSELAEIARNKRGRVEKKTLTDGSVVIEAEPRPLEHYEDTPPEVVREIDTLIAKMLNFELPPKENAAAKRDLVAIGRPALPALLTQLYVTPMETDEQAEMLNLINQSLEEITGHYTTFKPGRGLVGLGTSEERRQSGIKQWFGWYFTKGRKFEENTNEDLIDTTLTPRNASEQRAYERALKDLSKDQD